MTEITSNTPYAREGPHVVVPDMHEEPGQRVVREIEQAGGQAVFVLGEASKPGDFGCMVQQAVGKREPATRWEGAYLTR